MSVVNIQNPSGTRLTMLIESTVSMHDFYPLPHIMYDPS
jgi:hypothetical protein